MSSALCTTLSAGCGNCSPTQLAAVTAANFTQAQVVFLCTNLLTQTVNTTVLANTISGVTGSIQGLTEGLNCTYLFLCAALVFVMHGGFAMVSSRRYLHLLYRHLRPMQS